MENKYNNVCKAYTIMITEDNKKLVILNDKEINDTELTKIRDIQYNLDIGNINLSYEVMADACSIINDYTMEGAEKDNWLKDGMACDFLSDADSRANVYTGVQLSYLDIHNEQEISELMKDEAITSIAQACSIWYSRKVAEACEALKEYIIKS